MIRPIDSAPKDGTDILVWDYPVWRPVHWTGWGGGCWRCSATGFNITSSDFKHWMEMPAEPEKLKCYTVLEERGYTGMAAQRLVEGKNHE